jgi:hypothetical protein
MLRLCWLLCLLCVLPSAVQAQTTSAVVPAVSGCTSSENHQFDFRVGKWEVFAAKQPQTKVADSLIEKLYAGCAIRENWSPLHGPSGGSFSAYVAADQGWRQTWIDSAGFADFKGGWNGTALVIQGVWPQPGHPTQLTRMTYTPHADGSVEQSGQISDDGGATWQPSFDLIYRHPA